MLTQNVALSFILFFGSMFDVVLLESGRTVIAARNLANRARNESLRAKLNHNPTLIVEQ